MLEYYRILPRLSSLCIANGTNPQVLDFGISTYPEVNVPAAWLAHPED